MTGRARQRPATTGKRPRFELRAHGKPSERPKRERWANWVIVDHQQGRVVGYFRYKRLALRELARYEGSKLKGVA